MNRILLILGLGCQLALAQLAVVNCGSATLGQTYAASSPSLQSAFTKITRAPLVGHLKIINPTSAGGICATTSASSSAPSTLTSTEYCTAAQDTESWDAIDFPNNSAFYIYLRASQADCTTGSFLVFFW